MATYRSGGKLHSKRNDGKYAKGLMKGSAAGAAVGKSVLGSPSKRAAISAGMMAGAALGGVAGKGSSSTKKNRAKVKAKVANVKRMKKIKDGANK